MIYSLLLLPLEGDWYSQHSSLSTTRKDKLALSLLKSLLFPSQKKSQSAAQNDVSSLTR